MLAASKLRDMYRDLYGHHPQYFVNVQVWMEAKKKWKQMTSSCKYIGHRSYIFDCNELNERD